MGGFARCGLDDRTGGLEKPGALGRLDHRQADSILDRAAGIEHLELGQEERLLVERAELPGDAAQANEGRVADEIEDRFGVLHRAEYRWRLLASDLPIESPGAEKQPRQAAAQPARDGRRVHGGGVELDDDWTEDGLEAFGQFAGEVQLLAPCLS